VDENARLLSERLDGLRDRVILVSLSMGGADVRVALERTPPLAARIRAWINVSGLLHGSPLLDDLLDARFPSSLLVSGALRAMGGSRRMLPGLSAKPGAPLAARFRTPPGLLAVNVVGLPLREHLTGNAAARHARLAPLGPNDGSTLVPDALALPGLTYPGWGADHYMRAPGVDLLLARLLGLLARVPETDLLGMAA
jgi:pimeloyl-ACP methyl ester carboxylesterase